MHKDQSHPPIHPVLPPSQVSRECQRSWEGGSALPTVQHSAEAWTTVWIFPCSCYKVLSPQINFSSKIHMKGVWKIKNVPCLTFLIQFCLSLRQWLQNIKCVLCRACFCKFRRLWKPLPCNLNERSWSQSAQMPQITDVCSAISLHISLQPWWPSHLSTCCMLCLWKEKAENPRTVWPQVLGKSPQYMAGPLGTEESYRQWARQL